MANCKLLLFSNIFSGNPPGRAGFVTKRTYLVTRNSGESQLTKNVTFGPYYKPFAFQRVRKFENTAWPIESVFCGDEETCSLKEQAASVRPGACTLRTRPQKSAPGPAPRRTPRRGGPRPAMRSHKPEAATRDKTKLRPPVRSAHQRTLDFAPGGKAPA